MNMKSKTLRTLAAALVMVVIVLGFVTNFGIGTLSAPGLWDLSILCPLGALGTMLATKMMIPRAVISLIAAVLLIVVFARAFCGWVCPIPLVQKLRGIFSKKLPAADDDTPIKVNEQSNNPAGDASSSIPPTPLTAEEAAALKASCSDNKKEGCATCASKRGNALDARHFVLGGALASTFIFGFPVFCLVCPIGLTFATIFLVINLFAHGDVTWSIIVVPALLIVEVLLFKKWCRKLCPLSAFMSPIAKANKTFVPTIDDTKCLETSRSVACGACGRACEEGIDPRHPQLSEAAWSECTKCRACVDACPTRAITMPLLPKRAASRKQPVQPAAEQEATPVQAAAETADDVGPATT
ncbi:MAG: 4Fe-4S binding protein [Gordonibacter sp.]|uniref:4Fe-4S binding protein n=1 Tax=Gordonibacter sp. TaxID=1968902 RepID=UPI002FC7903A